jgi:type III secretion protein SpaR/YscT/HrcT
MFQAWLRWLPADLERWLWALGVGAARTVPIAFLIPAFGGTNVPTQIRMGLGLALSVVCLPQIILSMPREAGTIFWMLLLMREILVGFTVGLVGSSVFRAAEGAGRLIDTLRGAGMAEVMSPVTEGRASPLGDILLLLSTVIFLELGGIGHVINAMSLSYEAVPLDMTTTAVSLGAAAKLMVITSAKLLEATLALAAPAVVAMFLADLVLGAIARMAHQIPVYFVGMPLKALGGVAIVLVGMGALQAAIVGSFKDWLGLIQRAFMIWR